MAGWCQRVTLITDLQMAFKVSPPDKHLHVVAICAFLCVQGIYPWFACWWHGSRSATRLEGVCGQLDGFTYQVPCSCRKTAAECIEGGRSDEVAIERALEFCQKVRQCVA